MGYAKQGQNTAGIHIRLYARAFVVEVKIFGDAKRQKKKSENFHYLNIKLN